jgi:hypothetical protein
VAWSSVIVVHNARLIHVLIVVGIHAIKTALLVVYHRLSVGFARGSQLVLVISTMMALSLRDKYIRFLAIAIVH